MIAGMVKQKTEAYGLQVSHEMLRLIAEVDEFKGRWEALSYVVPVGQEEEYISRAIDIVGSCIENEKAANG